MIKAFSITRMEIFNCNYQLSNFVQDKMYSRVKERHATPRKYNSSKLLENAEVKQTLSYRYYVLRTR